VYSDGGVVEINGGGGGGAARKTRNGKRRYRMLRRDNMRRRKWRHENGWQARRSFTRTIESEKRRGALRMFISVY